MGRPVGRIRATQKANTRERVVAAARALFMEVGYEAATIREIARRAGVAPGSVFTTFESKSALLMEVILCRYQAAEQEVRAAAAAAATPRQALLEAARRAYAFQLQEPRLLAEMISASWLWSHSCEMESRNRLAASAQIIADAVDQICPNRSAEQRSILMDIIFSCHLRNFRRALFDSWTVDQLTHLFEQQLNCLFSLREEAGSLVELRPLTLDRRTAQA